MSIETLKEQARRHEKKEEWQKALNQYKKAIAKLDEDDQPDIGLYNRVGDLYVRVGDLPRAVEHYEEAVDLYMEAELPNNAIAVLKKVIRNVPDRHQAFLRMGQVRAAQGFLPDARANFLTYAERMQQTGDMDESFRALVEFCDLAPADVALRRVVADQMASHERHDEAVQQLTIAYRSLMLEGKQEEASFVERRILELNPDADLVAVMTAGPAGAHGEEEIAGPFGEIQLGAAHSTEELEEGGDGSGIDAGGFEIATSEDEAVADAGVEEEQEEAEEEQAEEEEAQEEEAEQLPTFEFGEEETGEAETPPSLEMGGDEESGEAEAVEEPLPTFEVESEEEEEEEEVVGVELPLMDFDAESESGTSVAAAMEDARSDAEALTGATPSMEEIRERIAASPDDIALHQRFVELAYEAGDESVLADAYMGLGEALQRDGQEARGRAAFQQVLEHLPDHARARAALGAGTPPVPPVKEVASHEDYVDLGSLVLGEEGGKTTRFVVANEEPSGDESADFAKMLSQFKRKVSQNLDADDVRAHHDLGTAYMEMGLLDEAVTEFQQALRASQNHLPTYELLGQTFMEMGRYDAAVRSLERALDVPFEVEDELLGIYYYLGRSYEAVGNRASALEFYERVFSLDINFADVTERLRALR